MGVKPAKKRENEDIFFRKSLNECLISTFLAPKGAKIYRLQVLLSKFFNFIKEITQNRHWIGNLSPSPHQNTDPDSFRIRGGFYA